MSINHYVANATGKLSALQNQIESSFQRAVKIGREQLKADEIDVVFIYAPKNTIPELGVGAYSPDANIIYVSFDPEKEIDDVEIVSSILHEMHHCMRWREPGYGKTLGEAMVSEGLATLYEEEIRGEEPIYSQAEISDEEIEKAKSLLNVKDYPHEEWFFGRGKITRWFGYTYGYRICKEYGKKTGKTAAELVHEPASSFYQ